MVTAAPTQAEVLDYFTSCSNWGRWGKDDVLGTLNHITPEKRASAAALVSGGITVSCSRPVTYDYQADVFSPALHFMQNTGEPWIGVPNPDGQIQHAMDYFTMPVHTMTITHLDAMSHFFWNGQMYNGYSSGQVTASQGARTLDIESVHDGIVSRGVLLDVPALRGVDWLELQEPIYPDDLLAAEAAEKVRVEPGDVLFVRTGHYARRMQVGPQPATQGWAGLHAACIPYLFERGVALLGTENGTDVRPSGYEKFAMPVHEVGIVAMGLSIMDNGNFNELAKTCRELGRWEFLVCIAPLRLTAATGSPVNPLAVF
jgi:kynurenine formamidase